MRQKATRDHKRAAAWRARGGCRPVLGAADRSSHLPAVLPELSVATGGGVALDALARGVEAGDVLPDGLVDAASSGREGHAEDEGLQPSDEYACDARLDAGGMSLATEARPPVPTLSTSPRSTSVSTDDVGFPDELLDTVQVADAVFGEALRRSQRARAFGVGDLVLLRRLDGARELNGALGIIATFVPETSRWGIDVRSEDGAGTRRIAVREANLVFARGSLDTRPPARAVLGYLVGTFDGAGIVVDATATSAIIILARERDDDGTIPYTEVEHFVVLAGDAGRSAIAPPDIYFSADVAHFLETQSHISLCFGL